MLGRGHNMRRFSDGPANEIVKSAVRHFAETLAAD